MQTYRSVLAALLLAMLATAATSSFPDEGDGLLAMLRALEGRWDGIRFDEVAVDFDFRVHSANSAVLMTQTPQDEPSMVTVFHPDGDNLMVTHYCSAKNQPRMRAVGFDAKAREIAFEFVDITNLTGPDAGHMRALKISFVDSNHLRLVWTWHENGKDWEAEFRLTRRSEPGPQND